MGDLILVECEAVPLRACQNAIRFMEYASKERVMFEMLCLTGCRLSALDNMRTGMLIDGIIYFHPGKNQKRYLKETLPAWYLKELCEYRKKSRVWADHLFSCNAESFARYFNKIRPKLTPEWNERVLMPSQGMLRDCHRYLLKSVRKLVFTADFRMQLEKWHDAYVALEMTSKGRASHTSCHTTAYHYLRDFEQIGNFKGSIADNLNKEQRSLIEY